MMSKSSDPYLRALTPTSADHTVRPDRLVLEFRGAVEAEPLAGLERLQLGVAVLERGLQNPAFEGTDARVRMTDFRAAHMPEKVKRLKSSAPSAGPHVVSVQGVVEVTLAPNLDFWARARLVAQLNELGQALRHEGKRFEPIIDVTYGRPEPRVADPEQHRASLTQAWVQRARMLADAAGSTDAPLHLRAVDVPDQIRQRAVSLEAVALELSFAGRLDVTDAPSAPDAVGED